MINTYKQNSITGNIFAPSPTHTNTHTKHTHRKKCANMVPRACIKNVKDVAFEKNVFLEKG